MKNALRRVHSSSYESGIMNKIFLGTRRRNFSQTFEFSREELSDTVNALCVPNTYTSKSKSASSRTNRDSLGSLEQSAGMQKFYDAKREIARTCLGCRNFHLIDKKCFFVAIHTCRRHKKCESTLPSTLMFQVSCIYSTKQKKITTNHTGA